MEEVKTPGQKPDLKASATNFKDHLKEYVDTYVQVAKSKATRGASNAAAGATIGIAAFLFGFFFFLFLFMALGFWLGSVLDSTAAGFFIVSGFFLLLTVLVFALRKKVITPFIRNTIITKVYE
jgi:apolipoprotein N-acyltransferase